jgi:hypothetical protein
MRAGRKDYNLIVRQASIHVYREVVQVAEWGHGTDFTIGKGVDELRLVSQPNPFAPESRGQSREIDLEGGWQHKQDQLAIGPRHDRLGHSFAWNMLGLGDLLGREGGAMLLHVEAHLLLAEIAL